MKIGNAEQLRAIDKCCIENIGIPGIVLMERAAMEVCEEIRKESQAGSDIAIVCGVGNNAGDGFAVARQLSKEYKVSVYLLGSRDKISGDAKINFDIICNMNLEVIDVKSMEDLNLENKNLILDCIFGTGLCREVGGIYLEVIKTINNSSVKKISVDIPSGVEAGSGKVLGDAVMADITVTFQLPKIAMYIYPGRKYCGDIRVKDIGIPEQVIDKNDIKINLITYDYVKRLFKKREQNTHKGTYGKVAAIGGSRGYTGAVIMSAQAALNTGSGIVTVAVPDKLHDIAENKLTETITKALKLSEYCISKNSINEIKELIDNNDAIAIGMGMGLSQDGTEVLKDIIQYSTKPILIDADAISLLSKDTDMLMKKKCEIILTPHPGEMARLIGKDIAYVENNRIEVAVEFAKKYNVCLLLKGRCTVIAYHEDVYINETGNPGMAQGGSGDILSGIILSLLGQGKSPEEAASAGAFIHGLSADMLSREYGEYGITATRIAQNIPKTILYIQNIKAY